MGCCCAHMPTLPVPQAWRHSSRGTAGPGNPVAQLAVQQQEWLHLAAAWQRWQQDFNLPPNCALEHVAGTSPHRSEPGPAHLPLKWKHTKAVWQPSSQEL